MSPTIQDIADAANVSKAAVSYVINNKPGVSDDTRRRILSIMEKMNYRPNPQARGLAVRRTDMLGLMIPDITDPFYVNIVRGVEAKANELGYTLNLCTTHGDAVRERDVADMFASGRVDGLMLMTYSLTPSDLEELHSRGAPVIALDNPAVTGRVASVIVDNVGIGRMAASHLLGLGHSRLGFIHGVAGSTSSDLRYQGYAEELLLRGIGLGPALVGRGGFTFEGGRAAAARLLAATPRPTGIFAANDQMALGAMAAAAELGLSVPGDLSIVGVDDIEAASLVSPALTTLRQPTYEIGACAAEMLVSLLRGEDREDRGDRGDEVGPTMITFEATLVHRESTSPPSGM